jgi:prophage DNA circulation protein
MAQSNVNMGDTPNLPRCSFGGLDFPVKSIRIRGGLRDHVHEYPHTPGGAPEKLGRKLYEIEVDSSFHTTYRAWPGLWPEKLASLRKLFEAETTDSLVIPSIGTIQAYCTSWDQEMTARMLSGEEAQFRFREDQNAAFLVENLVQVSVQSLKAAGDQFALEIEEVDPRVGLFDAILDAVNVGFGIIDTANALLGVVEAKLLMIVELCKEADQRVELFQNPGNASILEALKAIWQAASELRDNILKKNSPLTTFVVPAVMPVTEISTLIYGSTDRAMEILQLNPIENAFEVPRGMKLRVYDAAA